MEVIVHLLISLLCSVYFFSTLRMTETIEKTTLKIPSARTALCWYMNSYSRILSHWISTTQILNTLRNSSRWIPNLVYSKLPWATSTKQFFGLSSSETLRDGLSLSLTVSLSDLVDVCWATQTHSVEIWLLRLTAAWCKLASLDLLAPHMKCKTRRFIGLKICSPKYTESLCATPYIWGPALLSRSLMYGRACMM